jgi:protease I
MSHTIVMVIASEQFRDEELFVPQALFEQQKYRVLIAGNEVKTARGVLGGQAKIQRTIQDIRSDDFAAIVLVGGGGAAVYWDDISLHTLLKEAYNMRRVIGAECIAPVTLANAGILEGKKATVWPSEATHLKTKGAEYTAEQVTVDGNIITANGPQATKAFANAVLTALKNKKPS